MDKPNRIWTEINLRRYSISFFRTWVINVVKKPLSYSVSIITSVVCYAKRCYIFYFFGTPGKRLGSMGVAFKRVRKKTLIATLRSLNSPKLTELWHCKHQVPFMLQHKNIYNNSLFGKPCKYLENQIFWFSAGINRGPKKEYFCFFWSLSS